MFQEITTSMVRSSSPCFQVHSFAYSCLCTENTTGSGIVAATMANVILGLFIWVAIREDMNEGKGLEKKEKKQK